MRTVGRRKYTCLITPSTLPILQHATTGYYGGHGFKYLMVVSPVGLLEEVAGPYQGRIADAEIVRCCALNERLAAFSTKHGRNYKVYGDPAFGNLAFVSRPFPRVTATAVEALYNTAMSKVRISVEQAIGHTTQHFSALDFVRTERVGDGEVAKKYLVACFFRNVMTCLRGGNQISEYFGCVPPTLDEFLEARDVRDPLPPRLEELGEFPPAGVEDDV